MVQYRLAFCRHQSSSMLIWSAVRWDPVVSTPWRMLWLFLVMRKTSGLGRGTYLYVLADAGLEIKVSRKTYHSQFTPTTLRNRISACLINATPPP
jgi:hypothetical protein